MIEGEGEGEIDGGQSWADLLSVAPCRQYCYREQEQQGQVNGNEKSIVHYAAQNKRWAIWFPRLNPTW